MSGGNKKKPVEMVGADSIQEKQRYLQYTIQSMKFPNSFTACFQSNFILSGISFQCRVHYWDGQGVDAAKALWRYGAMALWQYGNKV